MRQELKEVEGLGRKRTSRMRSEEDQEENWPEFNPEPLGLLSGRSKWLPFSPVPIPSVTEYHRVTIRGTGRI